jgi:hypothetical protein
MNFSDIMYVVWAIYAVFFILTGIIMVLTAWLLMTLIKLLRTLNDSWRLRTAAQYEESRGGPSNP